jgi:hypothetical protein
MTRVAPTASTISTSAGVAHLNAWTPRSLLNEPWRAMGFDVLHQALRAATGGDGARKVVPYGIF